MKGLEEGMEVAAMVAAMEAEGMEAEDMEEGMEEEGMGVGSTSTRRCVVVHDRVFFIMRPWGMVWEDTMPTLGTSIKIPSWELPTTRAGLNKVQFTRATEDTLHSTSPGLQWTTCSHRQGIPKVCHHVQPWGNNHAYLTPLQLKIPVS